MPRRSPLKEPSIAVWAAAALLAACGPDRGLLAAVAGKTVYRGMGIEAAVVSAERWDGAAWQAAGRTQSGYHGSFVIHLTPGRYRLRGRAEVPGPGRGALTLHGTCENLELRPGTRRIDRVVIQLASDLESALQTSH